MAGSKDKIRVVHGVPSGMLMPSRYQLRIRYDVLSPMRDGVLLAMDLIMPDAEGKFPVILIRTPYNKVSQREDPFVEKLARYGYIVAIQDCRGRFNSDGDFDTYRQEHADGFDTVEWISAQEWCSGSIGMIGGSYVGQTQWYAASHAPKGLKAIVPTVSPPGNAFLNEPSYGGVMLPGMIGWAIRMGRRSFQMTKSGDESFIKESNYLDSFPLSKVVETAGISPPWLKEWLSHPTYDDFWKSCGYEEFWPKMTVPALNISGWWDMNFLGTPRNFTGMREQAATAEAREGQRLVIGPWPHLVNLKRALNGLDFGPDAMADLDTYTMRFFDYWLRGEKQNGLEQDPRVHVFMIGANQWWEADDWPLPGTQFTDFYLHSGGSANTHHGDGRLSRQGPHKESSDQYISDPKDPIRVSWEMTDGPMEDQLVSGRSDVLSYTSDVLAEPVDVVGPVTATLYAASSAKDCDWHVRLVDVHPDGKARFLCHGALRARFREGFEKAVFLEPGKVEEFNIDMTATGVRFLAGHRIRVEISSSWYPRFELNPQTDAENWMKEMRDPIVAKQTVYHDSEHSSRLRLPLMTMAPD